MKLIYVANVGIPSDWAHSVQIIKMCEAFAENGATVKLVVAGGRDSRGKGDPFTFYNVKPIFEIVRVPNVDLFRGNPSPILYWIRTISFLLSARIYILTQDYDVLYTRELYATPFFRNVFLERHSFSKVITKTQKFIFKICAGLVVLTSFIKSRIIELGIDPEKIIVSPDAVRIEDSGNILSKTESRKKLGLPDDSKIFGYVGTLKTMGAEKGVAVSIESLKFLPESYVLYIVGGEREDVDYYKKYALENNLANRVIFAGKVRHKEIPLHISACDVLIAPFPESEHYKYYMSPLKIFEYMAGQRPIVVTDLPSLREILEDNKTALFVPPNDPQSLSNAIGELCENEDLSSRLAENAYLEVIEKYTWLKRAEGILRFIKNIE